MSVRRYTSLGRLLEDTEPDIEAYFVHFEDHKNSMQAAKLLRGGLIKILKEQERLLRYILCYSNLRPLLSDGWKEDCTRILADDFDAEALSDYDPTPWCSGCGAMRKTDCHCGPLADNE